MASSYAVQRFLERQGSGSSTSSAGLRRNDSLDFLKVEPDVRKTRHKSQGGLSALSRQLSESSSLIVQQLPRPVEAMDASDSWRQREALDASAAEGSRAVAVPFTPGSAPLSPGSLPLRVPEARARAPQLADVKEAGATLLGESLSDDVFVPPHMLGRSLQSAAVASAVEPLRPGSVMEGVGRKLRGQDAARFRRAIMTQTGFLEDA